MTSISFKYIVITITPALQKPSMVRSYIGSFTTCPRALKGQSLWTPLPGHVDTDKMTIQSVRGEFHTVTILHFFPSHQ